MNLKLKIEKNLFRFSLNFHSNSIGFYHWFISIFLSSELTKKEKIKRRKEGTRAMSSQYTSVQIFPLVATVNENTKKKKNKKTKTKKTKQKKTKTGEMTTNGFFSFEQFFLFSFDYFFLYLF